MRGRLIALLLGGFLVFLLLYKALWVLTDWWWFNSVGYLSVYRKVLFTRFLLFLLWGGLTGCFVGANLWLARRGRRRLVVVTDRSLFSAEERELIERYLPAALRYGTMLVAAVWGLVASGRWWVWLLFWRGERFNLADPHFHLDISFYLFRYPLLQNFLNGLSAVMVFTAVLLLALYLYEEDIQVSEEVISFSNRARSHFFTLLGLFLLVRSVLYALAPFHMLTAQHQVYTGAGYTDIRLRFPTLYLLALLAVATAVVCFYLRRPRPVRPLLYPLGAMVLVNVLGLRVLPSVVQRALVIPNEIEREQPFIQRCIDMTRYAYGLDRIETLPFEAHENLQAADLARHRDIIENIRLWDRAPLKETYRQYQELRPYYQFHDLDVDRYRIEGRLQQVLLSARELSHAQLPSRTWINEHSTYTHGYGLVMTAANRVVDGLPEWLIQDIPPVSPAGLSVERPELYFGEVVRATATPPLRPPLPGLPAGRTPQPAPGSVPGAEIDLETSQFEDYLLVNTRQPEFDYPKGDEDVYTRYTGRGGVPIRGLVRRLAFALRFRALPILLTPILQEESRILINRHVRIRARLIAPFLHYDEDPYLVLGKDGRLYWILDAYTLSGSFPYSERTRMGGFNYVRNAVKVVVDAYDGSVRFYLADPNDPIVRTYGRIFEGLFRPLQELPTNLQEHLRYPQWLFLMQADKHRAYHMTDVSTFYNREDLWEIPRLTAQTVGRDQPMEPFYVLTRLPGGDELEYLLIIPFVPSGERRRNMIAWMCARCDPRHYGDLRVYRFPKRRLIYGPAQIQARINQDTEISRQLTLWGQAGSEVGMYSLLVMLIEESILYVQPIYIQADQNALPELHRVIVAFGDQLAMEPTLEGALARIFGPISWQGEGARLAQEEPPATAQEAPAPPQPVAATAAGPQPSLPAAWVQQGQRLLEEALNAQRKGDWRAYGERIGALQSLFEEAVPPPVGGGTDDDS